MKNKRMLSRYDGKKLGWFRWWKQLLFMIIIIFILVQFVFGVTKVSGDSMNPTLRDGQVVGILKLNKKNCHRGDIIAVRMTSGERYVKRIVAVAGDTVEVNDGNLYINGTLLEESYVIGLTEAKEGTVTYPYVVEPGRYFIVGDNREISIDSRTFGTISSTQLMGKVMFIK